MGLTLMTGRVACTWHMSRPRPWEQAELGPAGSCPALRGIRDRRVKVGVNWISPNRGDARAECSWVSVALSPGGSVLGESSGVPRPNPSGLQVTVAVVTAAPCQGVRLCWALPGATAPLGSQSPAKVTAAVPSAIMGQPSFRQPLPGELSVILGPTCGAGPVSIFTQHKGKPRHWTVHPSLEGHGGTNVC